MKAPAAPGFSWAGRIKVNHRWLQPTDPATPLKPGFSPKHWGLKSQTERSYIIRQLKLTAIKRFQINLCAI